MKLRSPRGILALLTALNFLNYLDRFVLAAVLERVKTEMHLTHFVAGALATIFLVGYFATSPIFAALAGRYSRKTLVAFGVAVWSIATFGTGLAHDLPTLIVMRALVGVGEASFATLAPTLIDDIAPPERKSRWLAIFFVATPLGSALGYLVGGAVEARWGWRHAFFVAGGPGLLLAACCLFIEEPARRAQEARKSIVEMVRTLMKFPSYVKGVLGYSAYTFAIGAFAYWAPEFLFKVFGMELANANFVFGAVTVGGGLAGTALGGILSDRNAAKLGGGDAAVVRAGLWVCAIGSFVGAPLMIGCFLAPTATLFFVLAFFCEVALFLNSSPVNAVILRSVPDAQRAGAMALAISCIHLLGDLWSPPLVGFAADHVPVRIAMMILPVAILASALLWLPRRASSHVDGGERAAS